MLRLRTVWCTAAALAVTFALAATSASAAASPPNWQACPDQTGFECATLQVPLDYTHPNGAQISLALIRHPATDPAHRIGSLLWNPGGPGGSGVDGLPGLYPNFPAQLRARFDIVSFDPRGIGGSDQLQCFSTPAQENALLGQLPPAGFPVGPTQTQTEINVWAQFDQACAAHGGPIQYHMGTADVARDMDSIRAALGEAKLDYYGISYGTYLGQVYANLFPSHVGHLVLDGNVDPVAWNDASTGSQHGTFIRIHSPLGAETGLRTMLSECGAVDTTRCAFSAGSPEATMAKYRTLLERLSLAPVTVSGTTFDYALTTALTSGYLESEQPNTVTETPGWSGLASLLQSLWTASGSPSNGAAGPQVRPRSALKRRIIDPLGVTAGSLSGNFPAEIDEGAYGVLCSESPNPTDPQSYNAQALQANATQSPLGAFGFPWGWLSEPCAQWQARDADTYSGPWNRSPVPLLLVGTLADSNTAYVSTEKAAAALGDARILTETGGGHTALINQSACVNHYTSAYIINGTLPPKGTVCDQDKPPF